MTSSLLVGGLDLSLTSTGMATVELGGPAPAWSVRTSGRKGSRNETLVQRKERLRAIQHDAVQHLLHCAVVLIEGPSHGSVGGSAHDRSGLWWLTVDELVSIGVVVVEVVPAHIKIYATGNGGTAKGQGPEGGAKAKQTVMSSAIYRYGQHVQITVDDEADAVVLAAMAARYMGSPIESSLPETHLRAMDKVAWPTTPIETVHVPAGVL